ncbi:MAG: aminopeptidase P family protein, partial [Oscillospiraceae bacterium]|nr:aminopeptidase P family protein [Oscillospiraceae bacterium]
DALLLTSPVSRLYAAGYPIAEGMSLICREACLFFTDSRYTEDAQNLEGFTVIEVDREHPYSARLNDAIAQYGIQTVGFEEDAMSHGEFLRLSGALTASLVPCQKQIDAPRQIKQPWELDRMRQAQAITDRTFAELLSVIQVGMTEKELAAELVYRLSRNGGEGLAFDPIVVTGKNTSLPHGVPSDAVICEGDFITMDFGAVWQGYCADMTRTVAIGYATSQMRRVYDTVLAAQKAGLAATRAGVRGCDIDASARKIISDAGYGAYFGHGYGHGLGLQVHEAPNPNGGNPNPMPIGAVCSAEPGIYLPGKFGVRIEDVVIITEDGIENLTKSPKDLIIL